MEIKPLISWSDDLSVGIEEIDEQHKIMVRLVNELYAGIIQKTDEEVVRKTLEELVQYTIVHFAVEESLMRIFDYPQYEEHKKHHQDLTTQVRDLYTKIQTGEAQISMELLNFLRAWLTNHIMIEDKHYSPYFLDRGLKGQWSKRSWSGRIWNFMHHKN